MHDLVIVGAGPGGIALAAEAQATGLDPALTLILEKGPTHNIAIRKFYPEQKLTTANYKGFEARCEGLLCISDMSKAETIDYFDRIIRDYRLQLRYDTEVFAVRRTESGAGFLVETTKGPFETRVLGVATGILGRPNKPKEYPLPLSLKERLLFDITSQRIEHEDVLVVGGGDTASEYVAYLQGQHNRVTLSYRQSEFTRQMRQNHDTLLAMERRGEVTILRSSNISEVADNNGRPVVFFREHHHASRTFDRVVYALGGTTPTNFLKMLGIAFTEKGPVFDAAGETNVPGLFVVGDLVARGSGGSIITAFNSAVYAMRRICEAHLQCSVANRKSQHV